MRSDLERTEEMLFRMLLRRMRLQDLLSNVGWMNGRQRMILSKELQNILQEGAILYRREQRKISERQDSEMLEQLKKSGMRVNDVTPEQKKAFIEATRPVYDEFKKLVGDELIEMARKANQ